MSRVLPIGHTKLNIRYSGISLYSTFVPLITNILCTFWSSNFYYFDLDKICPWNLIISRPSTRYLYFYCWRSLGFPLTLRCLIPCCSLCSSGLSNQSKCSLHLFIKPFRFKISQLSSVWSVIPSLKSLRLLIKIQQNPFPLFIFFNFWTLFPFYYTHFLSMIHIPFLLYIFPFNDTYSLSLIHISFHFFYVFFLLYTFPSFIYVHLSLCSYESWLQSTSLLSVHT
jgi:hypothetical protein